MSRVEIYRETKRVGVPNPPFTLPDGRTHVFSGWTEKDVLGGWRWRFISNGHIMADGSQGYSRRIDCVTGCARTLEGIYWKSEHVQPVQTRRGHQFTANVGDEFITRCAGEDFWYDLPVIDLTRTP